MKKFEISRANRRSLWGYFFLLYFTLFLICSSSTRAQPHSQPQIRNSHFRTPHFLSHQFPVEIFSRHFAHFTQNIATFRKSTKILENENSNTNARDGRPRFERMTERQSRLVKKLPPKSAVDRRASGGGNKISFYVKLGGVRGGGGLKANA